MTEDRISHPFFGELTWDESFEAWCGIWCKGPESKLSVCIHSLAYFEIPGSGIREISPESPDIFTKALSAATTLRSEIASRFIVDYKAWVRREKTDVGDFMKRLVLTSITVRPDRTSCIVFNEDDNTFFGGHFLMVEIEENGSLGSIDLAG
jgi:hypothetical protein